MKTNNTPPQSGMPKLTKLEYFALIIGANSTNQYEFDTHWANDAIERAELLIEELHLRQRRKVTR